MKTISRLLFAAVFIFASALSYSQNSCAGNLLTDSSGYYGGFEAGNNNLVFGTRGSDLYNGLPRNGSYQIVQNVGQLGGGGYLDIHPHSGNYFLASHTSNNEAERVWYANVKVVPGATYNFCTYVTLLKNLGNGANFIVGLYVNGQQVGTGRVTFDWTQICGTFTVPAGVTSVELSIRDPKNGLFFLAIDDICFSGPSADLSLGNQVWNDYDGDGKRDVGEPGIPGAPVNLYQDNNGDNLPDGVVYRTTNTDESGQYKFTNLPEGKYIVSMPLLPGYQQSPNMSTGGTVANPSGGCCSLNPDANIDNDNNLVRREGPNGVGGILYTNFITLTKGQEPTTDGDGSDGNFTMDMAQCGTSFIGDFVWNDLNSNGIQDTGEPGINGVVVNILFSDGTTASTTTINFNGRDGYYDFKNLGPGVHKISFVAPTGLYFTKANQGSDDGKDSDPVNGSPVTVTLVANQSDFTIDAGFSTTQPPPPPPDCTYSSNGSGYYGGFEAGSGNFPAGTGSDLYNGLPRNGSYQVVQNVNQLGGGGYLNIQPRSGSWFLASHTSNNSTERIWYSKFAVTPGQKYSFCAAVTLLKNLGNGAVFLVGVYANGVQIGEGRVGFNWTNICGDFTVPAGVTTLEFSIRDPKKGLFFLAIDDICITKTSAFKQALALTADVADTKNAVSIYPNPTTRFAKLNISTVKAATAEVRIINMTGNVVYRVTKKLNIGYNSISLNNLPEYGVGLYQVQVIMEDKVYNQQLLITK